MLEIRGLRAWYGNVQALHGIDINLKKRELVTLIGSNGAGKSTTLKSITGLLKKRSGHILFEGEDISFYSPARILQAGIALAPEGRWIFSDLTVEENLRMGAFTRPRDSLEGALEEQFELFPILKERRGQKGGTLSGGEQQMLAISRALMARPKLLLLDEPSLGLAPMMVRTVFSLIKNINAAGTSVLLVEQNSAMALSIADRGYVLSTGRIALAETAASLLSDTKVREVYLGGYANGDGI
ncbi:MAG: ABC transporter ATP-binding protein [Desulfarculales bacterium]|nr:ABC transporter ATP-binding protein [Desulfarculales bacterium]